MPLAIIGLRGQPLRQFNQVSNLCFPEQLLHSTSRVVDRIGSKICKRLLVQVGPSRLRRDEISTRLCRVGQTPTSSAARTSAFAKLRQTGPPSFPPTLRFGGQVTPADRHSANILCASFRYSILHLRLLYAETYPSLGWRFWWRHKLPDCLEHNPELFGVIPLQFFQLPSEVLISGSESLASVQRLS